MGRPRQLERSRAEKLKRRPRDCYYTVVVESRVWNGNS